MILLELNSVSSCLLTLHPADDLYRVAPAIIHSNYIKKCLVNQFNHITDLPVSVKL